MQTTHLWRPPAGQDDGLGEILSQAFSTQLQGAELSDAQARVFLAQMQETIEADAELNGHKLTVYRATPHMIRQATRKHLTTLELGNLLASIQTILDRRDTD